MFVPEFRNALSCTLCLILNSLPRKDLNDVVIKNHDFLENSFKNLLTL